MIVLEENLTRVIDYSELPSLENKAFVAKRLKGKPFQIDGDNLVVGYLMKASGDYWIRGILLSPMDEGVHYVSGVRYGFAAVIVSPVGTDTFDLAKPKEVSGRIGEEVLGEIERIVKG
jgi:hypothetical protein